MPLTATPSLLTPLTRRSGEVPIITRLTNHATARHDTATVIAVAVVVYALSSLLHEGVGHGGACLAVHGVARELSSMHFECTLPDDSVNGARIVAAGGTIATLIGGFLALGLYHLRPANNVLRYSLWLFAAVNLMQGTGYFLFSGIANVGDWAAVIESWEPAWLWRVMLAGAGFGSYLMLTQYLFRALQPFVGDARPRRYEHAVRLGALAYVAGGVFEVVTGLFNPGGLALVLLSGAAASLGGTSGLAWGPHTLRGHRTPSDMLEIPVLLVKRSWIMIVVALLVAVPFVAFFGPGIVLTGSGR